MHADPEALFARSNNLYTGRGDLLSMWQEIALNFYPERADFTTQQSVGADFASHLMNSTPPLIRRKMTDTIGALLRADKWFEISTTREDQLQNDSKKWLEKQTQVQYGAMYDRKANFSKVAKAGDADIGTFGQNVISVDLASSADALIYKGFHLRDCVWCEDESGKVDEVHVKWKPTAIQLNGMFPDSVSDQVKEMVRDGKKAYTAIECLHIVMPWANYEPNLPNPLPNMPFVSIHMESDTKQLLEFKQVRRNRYNVARWSTVSGYQYAHSPATMVALPDARMIQSMSLVLLDAGEKGVQPPMIGAHDAFRSDLNFYSGGFTSVDMDGLRSVKDAITSIPMDKTGLPMGFEMLEGVKRGMADLMFLNDLKLPSLDGSEKTAYEFQKRVQEAARNALPLLEPIESDYNGGICEKTFGVLLDNGFFGRQEDIPEQLLGQDIDFQFKSPFRTALDQAGGAKFIEAMQIIEAGAQLDPTVTNQIDVHEATRESLEAIIPASWMRDEKEVAALVQQDNERQQQQQAMEQAGQLAQMAGALPEGAA